MEKANFPWNGLTPISFSIIIENIKAPPLFVDRENPVSNHIYQRCGFWKMESCRQYAVAGKGFGLPQLT
jgi:hypothetical protein